MSPVWIIARLTWLRILRGKSKWMSLVLAAMPVLLAVATVAVLREPDEDLRVGPLMLLIQLAIPLAAAGHLAGAVGEELELKTFSYLWSRPVPRWSLLAGKLLAVVPALSLLFSLTCLACWLLCRAGGLDVGGEELARSIGAAVLAVIAGSSLAVGAGALFPRYPLAFVLGFGLVLDKLLVLVPAVQPLSAAMSAAAIAVLPFPGDGTVMPDVAEAVIRIAVNSAIWLGLGVWRIRTAEYALPDS